MTINCELSQANQGTYIYDYHNHGIEIHIKNEVTVNEIYADGSVTKVHDTFSIQHEISKENCDNLQLAITDLENELDNQVDIINDLWDNTVDRPTMQRASADVFRRMHCCVRVLYVLGKMSIIKKYNNQIWDRYQEILVKENPQKLIDNYKAKTLVELRTQALANLNLKIFELRVVRRSISARLSEE